MSKKQGGTREGAGRKSLPGTVMKSVKLRPEQWERARRIGQGNAAEGIRRALDSYRGIASQRRMREALHVIGEWDFRNRDISEAWDEIHGAGSWRRLID
jgi:hypothetical protein